MCVLQKVPQLRCKGFESPTVQQASWIRTLFPNLQSLMNQLLNFFLISKWIEGICISIPSKPIHFLFNSITFLKVKNEHYELSQITNNSRRKYVLSVLGMCSCYWIWVRYSFLLLILLPFIRPHQVALEKMNQFSWFCFLFLFSRNPAGRTGLVGRGLLGRWGPNHAADPIITR